MALKKVTVKETDKRGRVVRKRHRYVEASHGFVETTQGGDLGYGDPTPRGQGYAIEQARRADQDGATAEVARLNTKLREREADVQKLLEMIQALQGEMDELKGRVGVLEDRPPQAMPKSLAGELTLLKDRMAQLTHGTDERLTSLEKTMAILGNAAAAQLEGGGR